MMSNIQSSHTVDSPSGFPSSWSEADQKQFLLGMCHIMGEQLQQQQRAAEKAIREMRAIEEGLSPDTVQ